MIGLKLTRKYMNIKEKCCSNSDKKTLKSCEICGEKICKNCSNRVDKKQVCKLCLEHIKLKLELQKENKSAVLSSITFGAGAAVGMAIIWGVLADYSKMKLGAMSLLLAWVVGKAVFLGGDKRKGPGLQKVAFGFSALGILLGKYLGSVTFIREKLGGDEFISVWELLIHSKGVSIFVDYFDKLNSLWDILWVFLAFSISWNMLHFHHMHIDEVKD